MIQIVFTDNGKVHTVTFSGEEKTYWSGKFRAMLYNKGLPFEIREI